MKEMPLLAGFRVVPYLRADAFRTVGRRMLAAPARSRTNLYHHR